MISDVFIPARMESKRLPEKHLKMINGKPVIEFLINRLKKAKNVRKIVICTTTLPADEKLIDFCKKEDIEYFRGSEKDILDRLLQAAKHFGTDLIINVEGDKIYTDPVYVEKTISEMQNSEYDYSEGFVSENDAHHAVHGIIPAGIKTKTLEKICEIKEINDTETGYREFFKSSEFVKCKFINLSTDLQFPQNSRLTLDYIEDFKLAQKIFSVLGENFESRDIIELFKKKPELLEITQGVEEKWEKNYSENSM